MAGIPSNFFKTLFGSLIELHLACTIAIIFFFYFRFGHLDGLIRLISLFDLNLLILRNMVPFFAIITHFFS